MKNIKHSAVAVLLIISMLLTSCKTLFPTQRMLDDVLPYRDTHFYCKADLTPFSKGELKNAKTIYGQELAEYFYANKDRSDFEEEEKKEFMRRLSYLNHNYVLVRERYELYNDDGLSTDIEGYNEADQQFNAYYKLDNTPIADIIRDNNIDDRGQHVLSGNPNLTMSINLSTIKNVKNTYYEADADIYIPVSIRQSEYKKLSFGDTIKISFPVSSRDKENIETIERVLTLVATDSFIYKDDEGNERGVFVAPKDGIGDDRRLVNVSGEMFELYLTTKPVRILKQSRIAEGLTPEILMTSIMQGGTMEDYVIDDIVDKVEGGGYISETFKEHIYANYIYTDLKGYITTAINYKSMYIDIEYVKEYIKDHPDDNIVESFMDATTSTIPNIEDGQFNEQYFEDNNLTNDEEQIEN